MHSAKLTAFATLSNTTCFVFLMSL